MLLAARALALAATLADRRREWDRDWAAAVAALGAAFERHGVQPLETWPCAPTVLHVDLREPNVLGVKLPEAVARVETGPPPDVPPNDPSPEADACAAAWRRLFERGAALAALETSLWRLADEYRRTERRTAAIEHVLMPELDAAIATITQALEAIDQEEAIRVRRARAH
jgi:V/A-type H+-transporting ATPase subunit D